MPLHSITCLETLYKAPPPLACVFSSLQQPQWAWAVEHGIPAADLEHQYDLIRPEMAMAFPFELDKFQKEVGDSLHSLQ